MTEDTSRSTGLCPFRGRYVGSARWVFAFRNTHKNCWSLRAVHGNEKGLVIAHADSIALYDAAFVVSEPGRRRVLRTGRKNVHAGIIGELAPDHDWAPDGILHTRIRYNPRRCGAFTLGDTNQPVHRATHVHLGTDGIVRAGGIQ